MILLSWFRQTNMIYKVGADKFSWGTKLTETYVGNEVRPSKFIFPAGRNIWVVLMISSQTHPPGMSSQDIVQAYGIYFYTCWD